MKPILPFFLLLLALSTGFAQETVPVDWWDTLCETHPPCTADGKLDSTQIPFYTALYDSLTGEERLVPYHRYDLLLSNAKTDDWSDSAFIYRLNNCCNCLAWMMSHIDFVKYNERIWNEHLALGDTVFLQWTHNEKDVPIDFSKCEMYCFYTDTLDHPLKLCSVKTFENGFLHPGSIADNYAHFILIQKGIYYSLGILSPGHHVEIAVTGPNGRFNTSDETDFKVITHFGDPEIANCSSYKSLHQYSQRNKRLLRAIKKLLR